LTYILNEKAEPFIYKAFEDSSPVVRDEAVKSFYHLPDKLRVKVLPRLRELMEGDPDEKVRTSARYMLDRSGYD